MGRFVSRIHRGLIFAGVLLSGFAVGDNYGEGQVRTELAAHRAIDCSECHRLIASTEEIHPGPTELWRKCEDCHDRSALAAGDSLQFHRSSSRPCTDCHSFHSTSRITAGQVLFRFRFREAGIKNLCLPCHANGKEVDRIGAAHREAAVTVYHRDYEYLQDVSPSEACLICHSNQVAGFLVSSLEQRPPRFNPHASHPLGRPMIAGHSPGGYSERLPDNDAVRLVEGRIECQTCHDMTSPQPKLLPVLGPETDLCTTCHVRNR